MKRLVVLLSLVLATMALRPMPAAAQNVLFIVDFSGSMKEKVGGRPKIVTAKEVFRATMREMPATARVGLMVYGHRRAGDCKDIELMAGLGQEPLPALADRVDRLDARGETPIATALLQSVAVFAGHKGESNSIVLITDGREECHGDPCAATQALVAAGIAVKVDVVGFNLSRDDRSAVECITRISGGRYFDAKDTAALRASLAEVRQTLAQAAPPPPAPVAAPAPAPAPAAPAKPPRFNLLGATNGGEVLAAPQDLWRGLNDGKEDWFTWLHAGEEGVFGFKDGRPATFDTFTVFVGGASGNNLKDFELLAGDEGPTGAFRSIGKFTAQNLKLFKTPYQEFKFAPVTAKYLKVRLLSNVNGDGYVGGTEFQLLGDLAPAAAPPQPAAAAARPRTNLLAATNGGELLAAPTDLWRGLNDGKEDWFTWLHAGEEGVFGFKDGQPATFDTFAVFIGGASGNNLKELELLAGNDAPTGDFRSIGKFTLQNLKLFKSPYQAFTFAPVTARYLKVRLLSNVNGDGYVGGTEFQLLGDLAPGAAPAAQPAAAPAKPRTNLLAAANGGELLAAPTDLWSGLNDGKEDWFTWLHAGEEGVFGFKDEKPATFDTFAVFIGGASGNNLKEFELLAGDEGPTGEFRSIGKFTLQNVKLLKSPYQAFTFAPVTSKYLKVRLLSNVNGDGYIGGTEFQLLGEPGT